VIYPPKPTFHHNIALFEGILRWNRLWAILCKHYDVLCVCFKALRHSKCFHNSVPELFWPHVALAVVLAVYLQKWISFW